jgi:hypothetical protein
MMIWLLVILLAPGDSIMLAGNFSRAECYDGVFYLTPGIGTSILRFRPPDSLNALSFTDDVNYRIRSFKLTPFAFYINRGTALEKYYPVSGRRETVHTARDISSFDLTPVEEVILADRENRELIFLDREFRVRFKVENISVEDMQWHADLLYVLTRNGIDIYDEHGNQVRRKTIPERCDRIIVSDDRMLIFTAKANYIFKADTRWMKKEFPYTISDICVKDSSIVILDGAGSTLHILNQDDF